MNSRSFSSSLPPLLFCLICIMPAFPVSYSSPELHNNCRDAVFKCGNIHAGYPFHGGGPKSECGHPRLELRCDDDTNTTTIDIVGVKYQVLEILHDHHILRIQREDFMNAGFCNPQLPIKNSMIDHDLFDVGPEYSNLTLLYDCPSSIPSNLLQLPCKEDSKYKNITVTTQNVPPHGCVTSLTLLVPGTSLVKYFHNPSVDLAEEEGRKGFEVKWKEDWDEACRNCNASGGACGFNDWNQPICYCPHWIPEHPNQCLGSKSKLNLNRIIGLPVAVIVLVSIACFIVLRFRGKSLSNHLSRGKINNNARIEAFITKFGSFAPNRYSYGEIKKMTNNFKDKLGQGGFGSVYKGKLPDGRLVAVKVLSETKGNGEDFMNEVASISRTSHVNIVCLHGFCFGSSKRALIYEFLSRGSLDKFIYSQGSDTQSRQLDWKTLYDIALGIAKGLEYLHQGCSTRILHFDIKPHNILLDDDFCPKIADFGLSKLCERKESVISMTGARGTAGYIAPEVFSRNMGGVSHKSDVYSYGMMVLEMIGGRRNIEAEASQTSEIYYPSWIYKHLDECMKLNLDEEITGGEGEIKKKMIAVSLCCIQTNPVDRPSITKVLEMLQGSLQSLILPPRPP